MFEALAGGTVTLTGAQDHQHRHGRPGERRRQQRPEHIGPDHLQRGQRLDQLDTPGHQRRHGDRSGPQRAQRREPHRRPDRHVHHHVLPGPVDHGGHDDRPGRDSGRSGRSGRPEWRHAQSPGGLVGQRLRDPDGGDGEHHRNQRQPAGQHPERRRLRSPGHGDLRQRRWARRKPPQLLEAMSADLGASSRDSSTTSPTARSA